MLNEGFVPERREEHSVSPRKLNGDKSEESGVVELQLDNVNNRLKQNESVYEEDDGLTYRSENIFATGLEAFWNNFHACVSKHRRRLKRLAATIGVVLLLVYGGAVIWQFQLRENPNIDWCHGYGLSFIIFSLLAWAVVYYNIFKPYLFPWITKNCQSKIWANVWRKSRVPTACGVVILLAAFLIWDTASNRRRLISIGGLIVFIAFGFLFSKHPTRVKWRTVFVGLLIQFIIGILAIRWQVGRQIFRCAGNLAEKFLEYAYVGASLVYGDRIVRQDAVFAFQALSAIFYVSMIVQVLFYLGWMQVICLKLGWLIQATMGTTVMESVNAVSSVFLGMSEAPLMYKPYIKDLTKSELHAVMAGGFSTIAGTVFAAYASLGVDPTHIITASIMTAPAALCYAKLVYPENTHSKTDSKNIQIYKSEDKGILDAAIQGATLGMSMVLAIIATVIACVSIVAFFNDLLAWLGMLVNIQDFTLETICSYLFFPIVWLMGVEPSECLIVARLIGIKVTVNEFVAYIELGELKKTIGFSPRTEAIATYALCSFANPGSIGVLISTLTTLCPEQRFNIIEVSFRAFLSAVVISFLTACIAGALMPEEGFID
uniref:Sodium/nucleoside cotransporter n=1 Tax=Graphocephala atropunctata TaxID=36148 RepID=A0A1B6M760_9HEMI